MYLIRRNKVYHLYYFDKRGIPKSKSTKCTSKTEANKFAHNFLNSLPEQEDDLPDMSFEQYKNFYLQYAATRFTTDYQKLVRYSFQQFEKVIPGSTLIKEISIAQIEEFIKLKLTVAKEQIINAYLRTVKAAFQRAVEQGFLKDNVFRKVKKLRCPENEPAHLRDGEFEILLEAESDNQLKLIYQFAIYTGLRLSEIIFLRWESIDFDNDVILVRNHNEFTTKSKKFRNIPLHPILRKQLQTSRSSNSNDEYVFMRNGDKMKKNFLSCRFARAVKTAGLSNRYHFHSLRHSFASSLVRKGVSIYHVSKLLGHADIKTTMIYSHLNIDDLRNAVEKLD